LITGAPFSPEPLREHYRDLPGFRATLSVRASILNRAEFLIGSPRFVYDDVAFRGDDPFSSRDNLIFAAILNRPTPSLAYASFSSLPPTAQG